MVECPNQPNRDRFPPLFAVHRRLFSTYDTRNIHVALLSTEIVNLKPNDEGLFDEFATGGSMGAPNSIGFGNPLLLTSNYVNNSGHAIQQRYRPRSSSDQSIRTFRMSPPKHSRTRDDTSRVTRSRSNKDILKFSPTRATSLSSRNNSISYAPSIMEEAVATNSNIYKDNFGERPVDNNAMLAFHR